MLARPLLSYDRRMRIAAVVVLLGFGACGPADKGADGEKGATGAAGPMGVQGEPGPSGTTGQDIVEALGNGQLQVTAATNYTVVPGLSITANVPMNTKLHVDTNGGIQCSGIGNAYSVVDVAIFIDGSISPAQRRVVAANTAGVAQMLQTWSFGRFFFLPAGSHTIDVRVAGVDPGSATANVSSANAPQLQGVLTLTTLKL